MEKEKLFDKKTCLILASMVAVFLVLAVVINIVMNMMFYTEGIYQDRISWRYYPGRGELIISGDSEIKARNKYQSIIDPWPFTGQKKDNLKSIVINDGITGEYGFFRDCVNLEKISYSSNMTAIGGLTGDVKLKEVVIPQGVTELSNEHFSGCKNLKKVVIPVGITFFGGDTFKDCNSLKDVYYEGTKEQWETIEGLEKNPELNNATMHYDYKY